MAQDIGRHDLVFLPADSLPASFSSVRDPLRGPIEKACR